MDTPITEATNESAYNHDLLQLRSLISEQKVKIFSKGKRDEILSLLEKLVNNGDRALKLIKDYELKNNSSLIEDLKGLSSNYDNIKRYLSSFIKYGIIDDTYPHDLKNKTIRQTSKITSDKVIEVTNKSKKHIEFKSKQKDSNRTKRARVITRNWLITMFILVCFAFLFKDVNLIGLKYGEGYLGSITLGHILWLAILVLFLHRLLLVFIRFFQRTHS